MIIWFAMGIPVVTAIVLFFGFKHRTKWWEFFLPVLASFIMIFIMKSVVELAHTSDTEYWGGWAVRAEYYESWDERVSCSHAEYDSDGNFTGYAHMYDVSYHSAYWQLIESNGLSIGINESRFNYLVRKFGNKNLKDLHRDYHLNDGDKYVTNWNGSRETFEAVTTVHRYENRVQVASSVFNFPEVDPKTFGLFEYPEVKNYYQVANIFGDGGPTMVEAEEHLSYFNATLGRKKQVRMWILVFKDKPLEAGLEQESYWQGGNKNEFTLAIGVNDQYAVQWVHPISWTEVDMLKIEARHYIDTMKTLDLVKVVDWLGPKVEKDFIRKPFAEFSYLTVNPPLWGIILTFVITAILNFVLSLWLISNRHRDDKPARGRYRRNR